MISICPLNGLSSLLLALWIFADRLFHSSTTLPLKVCLRASVVMKGFARFSFLEVLRMRRGLWVLAYWTIPKFKIEWLLSAFHTFKWKSTFTILVDIFVAFRAIALPRSISVEPTSTLAVECWCCHLLDPLWPPRWMSVDHFFVYSMCFYYFCSSFSTIQWQEWTTGQLFWPIFTLVHACNLLTISSLGFVLQMNKNVKRT